MSNKRINHSPFVTGMWVEFNGWRLKNPYMIRLDDGSEMVGIPNADAWSVKDLDWVNDTRVTHIRPLADGEADLGRQMNGGWRLARDIDMFGKTYPVWCGKDYGFVYEDELPEGKQITPVRIQAHRNKRDEKGKITLFITQGLVVDKSDIIPTLQGLQKYIDVPGFWFDPELEIMSNNETIWSIHWAADYLRILETEPHVGEMVSYLQQVVGQTPDKYLPFFRYSVMYWNKDKVEFKRQMEMGSEISKRETRVWSKFNFSLQDPYTKADKQRAINLTRGPESDKTFDINMLEVSNFLKNPHILPPSFTEYLWKKIDPLNSPA